MCGPSIMESMPTSELTQMRQALLEQLPPLLQVIRGSLIERYKRCGKAGCRCAHGQGHGPKYYLSVSRSGGRPRMDYVPLGQHERVSRYVANYRRVEEILESISSINRELLHRKAL